MITRTYVTPDPPGEECQRARASLLTWGENPPNELSASAQLGIECHLAVPTSGLVADVVVYHLDAGMEHAETIGVDLGELDPDIQSVVELRVTDMT